MRPVPSHLLRGPFSRISALGSGLSARVLEGPQFIRIHESVYRHRDYGLTWSDRIEAARMALPSGVATTGLTRIRQLGLDFGDPFPLHFVRAGDCHRFLEDVVLHRTVRMPPQEDGAVTPAAAFVECCRWHRTIDLIKIGDWLLFHGHAQIDELRALVSEAPWRAGADQAAWLLPWLCDQSRSLPESDLRSLLVFAGLPWPEVNAPVDLTDFTSVLVDLWYPRWRVAAEYEGGQHQTDRDQYVADVDRFRLMRSGDVRYAQITKERMRAPKTVVREIHGLLVEAGYDGPAPDFGEHFRSLFRPLAEVVSSARRRAS